MADLFEIFIEELERRIGGAPLLFVLTGHNGAGKSTCYRKHLKDALAPIIEEHIDPDRVALQIREEVLGLSENEYNRLAQAESDRIRSSMAKRSISFSFETVFSDPVGEKADQMRSLREAGYVVAVLAVGLDSPEKSRQRVDIRVSKGGHDVPTGRLNARYPRVLRNFARAIECATLVLFVDNSNDDAEEDGSQYLPFALYADGNLIAQDDEAPIWWASVQEHLPT